MCQDLLINGLEDPQGVHRGSKFHICLLLVNGVWNGHFKLGAYNESPEAAKYSSFVVCGLTVKYISVSVICCNVWHHDDLEPCLFFPPVSTAMLLQTGSAFISLKHVFLWEPSVLSEGHQAALRYPNKHQEDPCWTEPITLMKPPPLLCVCWSVYRCIFSTLS